MEQSLTNLDFIKKNNLGIFYIWDKIEEDYSKLIVLSNKGLQLDDELNNILDTIKENNLELYIKIMNYLNKPLDCGQCLYENTIRSKNLGYTIKINKAVLFSEDLQYTPGGGFVCKKHFR